MRKAALLLGGALLATSAVWAADTTPAPTSSTNAADTGALAGTHSAFAGQYRAPGPGTGSAHRNTWDPLVTEDMDFPVSTSWKDYRWTVGADRAEALRQAQWRLWDYEQTNPSDGVGARDMRNQMYAMRDWFDNRWNHDFFHRQTQGTAVTMTGTTPSTTGTSSTTSTTSSSTTTTTTTNR